MSLNEQNTPNLIITQQTKSHLLISAKWTKFMALVGLISLGLIVLYFMLAISNARGGQQGEAILFFIGFLILSILYIIPLMFFMKYAKNLSSGLSTNNQSLLDEGFSNLKSLHKYAGIITLIFLILEGIAIIGAIIALIIN